MGTKTFDLVETISDLLKRIDEGRKTVRETQNVSDDFWRAVANREKAFQLMSELVLKLASLGGPAQSQAQAELDRQRSELQKLNDESTRLWLQLTETIAFIGPFSHDVALLLERLPLKPEWDVYRQAVKRPAVGDRGSWTDPPTNSALETLEMRLREMLDLAVRTQPGQVRRFEPFPTPVGTTWKDVSITFISEHRVQIAVLSVTQTRNFAEMGFGDQRCSGGKPSSAWACLSLFAAGAGRIERPDHFQRSGWTKVEKQVQFIRATLRELFGIPGEPLPFRKGSGYEAQFKIKRAHSYED